MQRNFVFAGILGVLWFATSFVLGQISPVSIEADPQNVGVGGVAKPGSWTPLKAKLTNQTAEHREVILRWIMPDEDGDLVRYDRQLTLSPSATVEAWTYGALPIDANRGSTYRVQVLDAEGETLYGQVDITAERYSAVSDPIVGVFGYADYGLDIATKRWTSHESWRVIHGLELHGTPDRWQGLSMFSTLVWAGPGGSNSPTDPRVSAAQLEAIKQWVRQGGHLVILWPVSGETWTDSILGDLLPFREEDVVRVEQEAPAWMGQPKPDRQSVVTYNVFRMDPNGPGNVVLRDGATGTDGRPVVVTRRVGFGQVTVSGIDWSQPKIRALGLPNGRVTVWHRIMGWQWPSFTDKYAENEIREGELMVPNQRSDSRLDRGMLSRTSMRETAGPALLIAVLLFTVYWLISGPILDSTMKKRGRSHQRWVGFAAVAAVFSVVAWAGAWFAKPGSTRISHVTILDIHANTNEVRALSYVSAFVPRFTDSQLALAPGLDELDNMGTISTAGSLINSGSATFSDTQQYGVDASMPTSATMPMRSTSKRLQLQFMGSLVPESAFVDEPAGVDWETPRGDITLSASLWPEGELVHDLPGTLRDVRFIYCPGNGQMPWVWTAQRLWRPGQTLKVTAPANADRLVKRPPGGIYKDKREWKNEGYLGKRIANHLGNINLDNQAYAHIQYGAVQEEDLQVADATMIEQMELLSFFNMLPPPNFRDINSFGESAGLLRPLAHHMDLSGMTQTRCLIVIGHLKNVELPIPVTIDGREPNSEGWVTMRWIYDLSELSSN